MNKSILFISYYHHPHTLTATRNYYLSTLMAEHGYNVHVLSKFNADHIQFNHHPNIHYHPLKSWDYRSVLTAVGIKDGVTSQLIRPGKIINWGYRFLLKYPFNLFIGEGGGFYYLNALKQGAKIIEQYSISHIYSSYRPITDHFIAFKLKERYPSVYWMGDFRDVLWWTKEDLNYQKKWIKSMVLKMDHISAVTEGIANFWSAVYRKKVIAVYNGLPKIILGQKIPIGWEDKFIINYSGRIYTDFQKADLFFQVIKDLMIENSSFAKDIKLHYSGINHEHWAAWVAKFNLQNIAEIKKQQPVQSAWNFMANAHINLLLTWTTEDIHGFIHGKFNEYLAIRKPILCLVEGDRDPELEKIYADLKNSLIVTSKPENHVAIKEYILFLYDKWKSTREVPLIDASIIDSYSWDIKAKPLLDLLDA